MLRRSVLATAACLSICVASAQDEQSLTRDEVSVIKKKLVAVLDAFGIPAGYAPESEHYNLPAEAYRNQGTGLYGLTGASADRKYGTQKQSEEEGKAMQQEYQKKMAEAQAKGDYQELARLGQEMGQKAGQLQMKASTAQKEPIGVSVNFNSNPGTVIDPDMVVFERPGVIALRSNVENGAERVSVYCDPVSLKETRQLSRVDLKQPEGGVARRTTVLSVSVEITGPAAEVEPWVKKADTGKILAQIDPAK
ncbi:MAG TPA: hypothetical protein VL221_07075 [Bacteroidota bacterium]|nr:hypothetical protein [Bacteroidota bacterium]